VTSPGGEPFTPGELVDGRYRVEHLAGTGGMGAVYRARDESRGVPVALKVVRAALGQPTLLLRLRREAELLARGAGGGVVRVEAMGRHRGVPFVALAWVDGDDLHQLLCERGRLDLPDALALVERLARTLQACHEAGVIHRDVKPANILLPRDPKGIPDLGGALLGDFGLAWAPDAESLSRTNDVLGTPAYMAPEQSQGAAASHDRRVDVWGLGAVLYHALTGGPPFDGAGADLLARLGTEEVVPPSGRATGLTPDVDRVVLKALTRDPAQRYATALELADDLARLRRGEPPLACGPLPSAVRRRAVRGLTIGLSVGVALLLVAWAIEAGRRRLRAREREALVAGYRSFAAQRLSPWNLGLGRGQPPARDALDAQATALRTALDQPGSALASDQAELQRGLALLAAARRRLERRVEPPAAGGVGALGDALTLLELERPVDALQAAAAAVGEHANDAAAVAGRALAAAPEAVVQLPPELLARASALAPSVRETLERTQAAALRRAVRGEAGPTPADVAAAVSRLAPALDPGAARALADARRAELDLAAEAWTAALLRASTSPNPADVAAIARRLGGALAGPPALEPGPALQAALDRLAYELADLVARGPTKDERGRRMLAATRLIVSVSEEVPTELRAPLERPSRREALERLLDQSLDLVDLGASEVPWPVEFVLLRLCFDTHEFYELRRLGARLTPTAIQDGLVRWPRSRALRVLDAVGTIAAYEEQLDAGSWREAGPTDLQLDALEAAIAPEGATLDLAEIHFVRALRILAELHLSRAGFHQLGSPGARPGALRALELLDQALPILLARGLIDEHHEVLSLVSIARSLLSGAPGETRLWEETAALDRARLAQAEADPQGGVLHVLERLRTLTKTLCRLAEEQALHVGGPGPALDLVLRTVTEARDRARSCGDPSIEGRADATRLFALRRAKRLDDACAYIEGLPPQLHLGCDHRLLREAYECLWAADRKAEATVWLERLRARFPLMVDEVERR
jgi:hypothetical protein